MLLVSIFMDLSRITCSSSLRSCDQLSFQPFTIFSFLLLLQVFLFFKWRSYTLFFPLHSLQSAVLQWHRKEDNFLFGYVLSNLLLYVKYCLESSSYLLYFPELFISYFQTFLYSLHCSSTSFLNSPNTSSPVFLVSRPLSLIIPCFKYDTWQISSWVQRSTCFLRVIFYTMSHLTLKKSDKKKSFWHHFRDLEGHNGTAESPSEKKGALQKCFE